MNENQQSVEIAIEVRDLEKRFLRSRGFIELWQTSTIGRFFSDPRHFAQDVVFSKVSFAIPRGSTFGIFGVNGAGKSTLLYCLSGLVTPDSGDIVINGRNVLDLGEKLGSIVSKFNTQEAYREFTAVECVTFMAMLHKLDPKTTRRTAQKLMTYLGMSQTDQEVTLVGKLSKGNLGKTALVNSLVPMFHCIGNSSSSPILLLDEASLGLDVVSVENFFRTLDALKQAIPHLTVVIASNDPREAAYCDDYIALVEGKLQHSPEKLRELKGAIQKVRNGINAFAGMIGSEENGATTTPLQLSKFDAPSRSGGLQIQAFLWRSWRDICIHKWLSIGVVMMLVLPNLIGLFASEGSFGSLRAVAMTIFGIYVTLLVRDSQRFIDRERGYFNTLETVQMAPVSLKSRYLSFAAFSWIQQTGYAIATGAIICMTFYGRISHQAAASVSGLERLDYFGLLLLLGAVTLAVHAIGLCTNLTTFCLRPISTWIIVSSIPTLVIVCSGIYYPVRQLPPVLSWFAMLNPLSYASAALTELLKIGTVEPFGICALLDQHSCLDGLSLAWMHLLTAVTLSIIWLLLGIFVFKQQMKLVIKTNRLRNIAMA